MATQPFMTTEEYSRLIKKNAEKVALSSRIRQGLLGVVEPKYRYLITKPAKDLTDDDYYLINLNPELNLYEVRVNYQAEINASKELEKAQKNLKKEYEIFVTNSANERYGLEPKGGSSAQSGTGNTIEDALGGSASTGTGNTVGQAVGGGSNTIEEGLAGQAPGVTSATGGATSGGSWEQPFNQAISTLRGTEQQVRSSADDQLHGAGIAANREAGYLKGLATRTGSSFGEAKLADDRSNAVFNEQAANIRAQRDAQLSTIGQNIAGVQQQLGSTRAQMYDSELARRAAAATAKSKGTGQTDLEKLIEKMIAEKTGEPPIKEEDLDNVTGK